MEKKSRVERASVHARTFARWSGDKSRNTVARLIRARADQEGFGTNVKVKTTSEPRPAPSKVSTRAASGNLDHAISRSDPGGKRREAENPHLAPPDFRDALGNERTTLGKLARSRVRE